MNRSSQGQNRFSHIAELAILIASQSLIHSLIKSAVDSYGEYSRHWESALSGKDPSRIDRVSTDATRHAAKYVVAAGLAQAWEVHLAYTIGIARPVGLRWQ